VYHPHKKNTGLTPVLIVVTLLLYIWENNDKTITAAKDD